MSVRRESYGLNPINPSSSSRIVHRLIHSTMLRNSQQKPKNPQETPIPQTLQTADQQKIAITAQIVESLKELATQIPQACIDAVKKETPKQYATAPLQELLQPFLSCYQISAYARHYAKDDDVEPTLEDVLWELFFYPTRCVGGLVSLYPYQGPLLALHRRSLYNSTQDLAVCYHFSHEEDPSRLEYKGHDACSYLYIERCIHHILHLKDEDVALEPTEIDQWVADRLGLRTPAEFLKTAHTDNKTELELHCSLIILALAIPALVAFQRSVNPDSSGLCPVPCPIAALQDNEIADYVLTFVHHYILHSLILKYAVLEDGLPQEGGQGPAKKHRPDKEAAPNGNKGHRFRLELNPVINLHAFS